MPKDSSKLYTQSENDKFILSSQTDKPICPTEVNSRPINSEKSLILTQGDSSIRNTQNFVQKPEVKGVRGKGRGRGFMQDRAKKIPIGVNRISKGAKYLESVAESVEIKSEDKEKNNKESKEKPLKGKGRMKFLVRDLKSQVEKDRGSKRGGVAKHGISGKMRGKGRNYEVGAFSSFFLKLKLLYSFGLLLFLQSFFLI